MEGNLLIFYKISGRYITFWAKTLNLLKDQRPVKYKKSAFRCNIQ